jgi:serine/threonine protein kinase
MAGLRTYFRCMFRALRDIHARGIIHRDVKPANFLFDPHRGVGTLVDLGLACVSIVLSVINRGAQTFIFISAWVQNPRRITANVCTLLRQRNTHMAGYGAQLNTTRTLSGKSRRMRECAAVGLLTGWVI